MKILDTTNGNIHEYGSNPHDSLEISQDGCALHYYNLQCGDGSKFGTYRFVMEDGKIPAESQTEDARYAECYFNIGGFGNSEDKPAWQRVLEECIREDQRPHGEWVEVKRYNRKGKRFLDCSVCHYGEKGEIVCEVTKLPNFCPNCGASMSKLQANGEQVKTNQWCKFKSEKNCDFCAFHSDCEIHWKDGE